MSRNRIYLIVAVVLVIGLAGWWVMRSGRENVAVDLVQQLSSAKRQPSPESFSVADITINNERKHSISVQNLAGTRVTWHATIPDNGWLKTSMAIREDGWTVNGDGVLFSVGVSDGQNYDELLSQMLNPFGNASDRRWNDISLDLSPYAGETVDIIFNTRSGPADNRNGDFAVWGEPRVIVR
jgi:hypothetical protein